MLGWALTLLVLALIAGAVGFSGVVGASIGASADVAWILIVVLLVLMVVAGLANAIRDEPPA